MDETLQTALAVARIFDDLVPVCSAEDIILKGATIEQENAEGGMKELQPGFHSPTR